MNFAAGGQYVAGKSDAHTVEQRRQGAARDFHGLFINLDSRPDRLSRIQQEFARYGLTDRYTRLRAISDPRPYLGCYRSHLKAIEEAQRIGGVVHILEDDSILSAELAPFLVSNELEQLLERYDIVHLDMWVDQNETSLRAYKAAAATGLFELGTQPGARVGAASSYVVAPRSLGKIKRLWRYYLDAKRAIDDVCGRLAAAGEIKVAVVLPFLTSVDIDNGSISDVQSRLSRNRQKTLIEVRAQFFVQNIRAEGRPEPAA